MATGTRLYLPKRYIPFPPSPRQQAFMSLMQHAREGLFGGALGGGKSAALLMMALQYVEVTGYTALILRRTMGQLLQPGGLIELARDWLRPTGARWSANNSWYTFPSGALLKFGFLRTEEDFTNYRGSEWNFIGIDELTDFDEADYLFMFTRLRSPAMFDQAGQRVETALDDVPIRLVGTANPGGRGYAWVTDRFVPEGFFEGEEEWEPKRSEDGMPRVFVPSMPGDNPAIDQDEYDTRLRELRPVQYAQLRSGDWGARETGGMFRREMFRIIDYGPVGLTKVRAWDIASSDEETTRDPDYTAGVLVGVDVLPGGRINLYIYDSRRYRGEPGEIQREVMQAGYEDGHLIPVYVEEERGGAGKFAVDYFRQSLPFHSVFGAELSGPKEVRAFPIAAMARNGNVFIVRQGPTTPDWVGPFLSEVEAFPNTRHRDQTDAFVHAATAAVQAAWAGAPVQNASGRPRRRRRKAV